MSHPDTENLEPQEPLETEDEATEEAVVSEETGQATESEPAEPVQAEPPAQPPAAPAIPKDHRMSRLMKMQSQFVTEEAIRSTEESAMPKPPPSPDPPQAEDEEFFDDEEFEEDFEDEEFEDDFEDDDYDEEEGLEPADPSPGAGPSAPEPTAPSAAAEAPAEPEDESDHRVAQLRKLRKQFVSEKDLELTKASDEQQVFKEVKIQKVVCPNCQSEEVRTHKMCSNCGAKLPNITAIQEETYNPGTMNAAVLKYVNAVNSLSKGEWSAEDFEEFLHDRQILTQNHIDDLHELVEECGSAEWLPDATKLLFESTSLLEETLENMLTRLDETRAQQADLEAEFDTQMLEYETFLEAEEEFDFEMDPPEPPEPVEERIRKLDFKQEIADIKKSNNLLLNTLRKIDEFQRAGPENIEL